MLMQPKILRRIESDFANHLVCRYDEGVPQRFKAAGAQKTLEQLNTQIVSQMDGALVSSEQYRFGIGSSKQKDLIIAIISTVDWRAKTGSISI